ncbi:MAG: T9SS type A sorting domain-containing protein [Bacteroidetes bacterium]|nr:MAG: T9SS type A sorting domain-containing protein [Bacteroidota bacterium]
MMRRSLFFWLASLMYGLSFAQPIQLYPSDTLLWKDSLGAEWTNPMLGGLDAPQFNSMDIDGDGINDLLIFDRRSRRVYPFVNLGKHDTLAFEYKPAYAQYFPDLSNWLLCRDINCDGKADLLTGEAQHLVIYRNTSTAAKPAFELWHKPLLDNTNQPIYVQDIDYPDLVDVDGDGDLDFLAFGVLGGSVSLYRNQKVEEGLHCDTLVFQLVDDCWGSFQESGIANDVYLGGPCGLFRQYKKSLHTGASILAIDMDGDSDMDLVIGDPGYSELKIVENGKTDYQWNIDTMIAVQANYPTVNPAHVFDFPAAFFVDLNNDGKRDLIVSNNSDGDESVNQDMNWLYLNSGFDSIPNFQFIDSTFLLEDQIDLGSYSQAFFMDVDNDGDLDLLVSSTGKSEHTAPSNDRVSFFEQSLVQGQISFQLKQRDWMGFSQMGLKRARFAAGDLNGDSLTDLLIGDATGGIHYLHNTGSLQLPNFTKDSTGLFPMDVGSYSSPALFDIDEDGDLDLFIGNYDGNVSFFRNRGSANNPVFDTLAEVDTLGRIRVSSTYWQYVLNDTTFEIEDSVVGFYPGGFAVPFVTDLDLNGKPELWVGGENGLLHQYVLDPLNLADTLPESLDYFRWYANGPTARPKFGAHACPTWADLHRDSMPELVLGNIGGGLSLLSTVPSKPTIKTGLLAVPNKVQMQVYPNPAKGHFNIRLSTIPNSPLHVKLYSAEGKLLQNRTCTPSDWNTGSLRVEGSPGLYHLVVESAEFGRLHALVRLLP